MTELAAAKVPLVDEPSEETRRGQEDDIAKLAYALWQQRGCPIGSPEFDWLAAEEVFTLRSRLDR